MQTTQSSRTVRFGPYEADFNDGVLRKHGLRLKIQGKPLAILQVLVENAGKIVTREELRRSLWPDNTFVDFDKNLSTGVNKLRDALCDSAEEAHYIETIPRKGYRFRAAVERVAPLELEQMALLPESRNVPQGRKIWLRVALAAAAIASVFVSAVYYLANQSKALNEKDTIVLSDFSNSTGDPVFDETLKTALRVSLQQSPFLSVLSDSTLAKTLKLMTRAPDTRLTPDVAREVCERAGSKAYVAGSIVTLGSEYVLGLKVMNCQTGDTLAQEQATAAAKEQVLEALGEAASKLRGKLGESLSSVKKFDVPLEQATTSSLEALQAFSVGQKAKGEKGPGAALPYFQRAIVFDPNFAMGYWAVGVDYLGLGKVARANEYITQAFQLRDRASDREKLAIAAAYYFGVTGELDKAAQTYQQAMVSYPREYQKRAEGDICALQGQYEEAEEAYRQSLALAPDDVGAYVDLVNTLLALQRFDDARQIIYQAQKRKLESYVLHSALYALGFLDANSSAMAKQQLWFAGKGQENIGIELAAQTEAYLGRLARSGKLTQQAVNSAVREDSKETAAVWQEIAAQREAAFGYFTEAKRAAADGLKLASGNREAEMEAALAFALAGDTKRPEVLAEDLNHRYPLHTQLQALWLPGIEAQVALNRKESALALNRLRQASSQIEFGQILFVPEISCLYPTYIRGQAYLAAGQGTQAAAEFQKILDHRGIVWNCWTGTLAHLGLARANALQSKTSQGADANAARVRALAAYKDFLTLWKDADVDIPIYKQAKTEYAKLQVR